MLVTMEEILKEAKLKGYGVAAPNCFNLESIRCCFEAAEELKSPVILDVGFAHGIEESAHISQFYAKQFPNVVYALNLDHGGPFEHIMRAIKAGFSSVMIDRSTLPFDQNTAEVKEIVKIAHALGLTVEAELGHVGQAVEYERTRDAGLTKKEEALAFVEQTGVDCLAVAVGTSHGLYAGTPHLEFELLKDLSDSIEIPLVLHGGSGTGDKNLQKAVQTGIQKVNLWTDLGNSWIDSLEKELLLRKREVEQVGDTEFKKKKKTVQQVLMDSARAGYKEKLMHYMKLFGSDSQV